MTEKEQKQTGYSSWNIYKKLAKARRMLSEQTLKKSGFNTYSNYYYSQLEDFLSIINVIFDEVGLQSKFWIESEKKEKTAFEDGTITESVKPEFAYLTIRNVDKPDEVETFSSATAGTEIRGANAIQNLGGKHTYMRRYLWLEAMEIAIADDTDGVAPDQKKDPKNGKEKPAEKATVKSKKNDAPKRELPATDKQIQMINDLGNAQPDRFMKMLEYYHVEKTEQLTISQASEAIKQLQQEKK